MMRNRLTSPVDVLALGVLSLLLADCLQALAAGQPRRPNILIITVDDMSADSLGAFGCKLADTSPNIDAFASQAMRFKHAHVQVGNCMPGRNIMWSGMLAHANGVEGFVQNREADYPVLCDLAKEAGYYAAIRGKVAHSTPYTPYGWDGVLDTVADGTKFHVKDAKGYGASARRGIALAKQAEKPFCLLINISDPHKPFFAQAKDGQTINDPHVPSRVFTADEVPVPGFLPDDQVIRKELAHYYSSVRRADDCFGEIMTALDESGQAPNTFVMFLSDHGMPLPFAKTQLYHHSTHTPLMVRWPGVTQAGAVDDRHMVSAVDFLPTLLDIMGHQHPSPERLHGRSFAPLIQGQTQVDRDHVILQYNENSGRWRHPMRGIQTREYLYLYNPWSDGERKFATATTGTMTYRQMVKRAESEPKVAARLALFDHRVIEELYDVQNDPDCLVNLIDHVDHKQVLVRLRNQLVEELWAMNDPVAPVLAAQEDVSLRQSYMAAQDQRGRTARAARRKKRARARVQNNLVEPDPTQAAAVKRPANDTSETHPASSKQPNTPSITASIQRVLETQQDAWNAGDIDQFMEWYWKSENLTFSSGGKVTRSWQGTLQNYKKRYPSRKDMGKLSFLNLQVTPLGKDAAFVLGEWQLVREPQDLGGNFTLVFRRLDDRWVIVHDHTSRNGQP